MNSNFTNLFMSSGVRMSKQERLEQIEGYLCEKFHLPQEQVGEMLPNFIVALASHLDNLDGALESGDLVMLGRAGHTMKGALLNLGLLDCVDIALEIEQKGKARDTSVDYRAMVGDLRKNLEVLIV